MSGKRRHVSRANGGSGSESPGASADTLEKPFTLEVGRLVDSSQADDRRMIRLVRERRLLYARNNMPVASYYTQVKKLWQEVANQMGWSVADVRRKWSHIRNSYSRHLRNELYGVRTGRGRMVSKWYLADELEFLREHMATDSRPSRYSYTPMFMDTKPLEQHQKTNLEQVDLKPFIASPWFAMASPPPASREVTLDQQGREDSSSPYSFEPDENSAYFQFFRGIHHDYLELPARKQRLFRRESLALLHRLLDEEEPHDQHDAINLSNSADTDDEREHKLCVIESVHGNRPQHVLPH